MPTACCILTSECQNWMAAQEQSCWVVFSTPRWGLSRFLSRRGLNDFVLSLSLFITVHFKTVYFVARFFFFFVYVYSCLGIKHIRPLNSLQPMCAYDDYVYCTLLLLISVPFRAMWGKNFIPDVEPYDA